MGNKTRNIEGLRLDARTADFSSSRQEPESTLKFTKASESMQDGLLKSEGDTDSPLTLSTKKASLNHVRKLANEGNLKEALSVCRRVIAANKLDPEAYYLLASIHQEMGELPGAIKALRRTLYLEPKLAMAHQTLAKLLQVSRQSREAARSLKNALRVLQNEAPCEILPYSAGITVAELRKTIRSIAGMEQTS